MQNFISAQKAAEILGYTVAYVRTLAKTGKISAYKRGANWFFKMEDLTGMFRSNSNGLDI